MTSTFDGLLSLDLISLFDFHFTHKGNQFSSCSLFFVLASLWRVIVLVQLPIVKVYAISAKHLYCHMKVISDEKWPIWGSASRLTSPAGHLPADNTPCRHLTL